jgi:hypothetical protein
MVCAVLAQRYAARRSDLDDPVAEGLPDATQV